eukprot:1137508-Pelagomonas_calceolata.AAC.3
MLNFAVKPPSQVEFRHQAQEASGASCTMLLAKKESRGITLSSSGHLWAITSRYICSGQMTTALQGMVQPINTTSRMVMKLNVQMLNSTDEYGGLCVLECKDLKQPLSANTPSKCKPQKLAKAAAMRISPLASPTTRGALHPMQEETSRLSPWAVA